MYSIIWPSVLLLGDVTADTGKWTELLYIYKNCLNYVSFGQMLTFLSSVSFCRNEVH